MNLRVRLFAKKGAKVVLASRNEGKLKALSQELPNSIVIPTDMTHEKDMNIMIPTTQERFRRIPIAAMRKQKKVTCLLQKCLLMNE